MATDGKVDVVDDKKLKKEKKSKDKSEKKEKKDKKRSESEGVHKEKKDKKKDKAKQDKLARALDAHLQADVAASVAAEGELVEVDPEDIIKPAEELVPFALPLADDKTHKKIYKLIKKGASAHSILSHSIAGE
jgi:H/ACA ribonucleoprotein complex subunit 2